MGRISNNKKICIQNLRKARAAPGLVRVESEGLIVTDDQQVEVVEETIAQSINSTLKDNGVNRKKPFSRGLEYSSLHQRKLKQKNREMA